MKNESAKRAERYISDISTVFMSDIDYRSYIEELVKIEKAKKAEGEAHGKTPSIGGKSYASRDRQGEQHGNNFL